MEKKRQQLIEDPNIMYLVESQQQYTQAYSISYTENQSNQPDKKELSNVDFPHLQRQIIAEKCHKGQEKNYQQADFFVSIEQTVPFQQPQDIILKHSKQSKEESKSKTPVIFERLRCNEGEKDSFYSPQMATKQLQIQEWKNRYQQKQEQLETKNERMKEVQYQLITIKEDIKKKQQENINKKNDFLNFIHQELDNDIKLKPQEWQIEKNELQKFYKDQIGYLAKHCEDIEVKHAMAVLNREALVYEYEGKTTQLQIQNGVLRQKYQEKLEDNQRLMQKLQKQKNEEITRITVEAEQDKKILNKNIDKLVLQLEDTKKSLEQKTKENKRIKNLQSQLQSLQQEKILENKLRIQEEQQNSYLLQRVKQLECKAKNYNIRMQKMELDVRQLDRLREVERKSNQCQNKLKVDQKQYDKVIEIKEGLVREVEVYQKSIKQIQSNGQNKVKQMNESFIELNARHQQYLRQRQQQILILKEKCLKQSQQIVKLKQENSSYNKKQASLKQFCQMQRIQYEQRDQKMNQKINNFQQKEHKYKIQIGALKKQNYSMEIKVNELIQENVRIEMIVDLKDRQLNDMQRNVMQFSEQMKPQIQNIQKLNQSMRKVSSSTQKPVRQKHIKQFFEVLRQYRRMVTAEQLSPFRKKIAFILA